MQKLYHENFRDIYEFRKAITERPPNGRFENASQDNDTSFAGMPYEKALNCLTDGLPEVAENLKREMHQFQRVASGTVTKRRPVNYYNGHSPNVPAAIIGLPKSMRKIQSHPQKVKTVTLYFQSAVPGYVDADDISKAGATVLKLAYYLELNGYRSKLVAVPSCTHGGGADIVCTITLKEFNQPFDALKVSFTLGSVAFYRRLGFRHRETMPGVTGGWSGHGRSEDNKETALEMLKAAGNDTRNGYYINVFDCQNVGFDPIKLASDLGIVVKEG